MTAAEGKQADRLARGEAVPAGPGACAREGCGHARVWHSAMNRRRPCERCSCASFTAAAEVPAAEISPAGQLDLYGADVDQIFGQLPLTGGTS